MRKSKLDIKMLNVIIIIFIAIIGFLIFTITYLNLPKFGRLPQGKRLERIEQSPNYRNGQFINKTPQKDIVSGESKIKTMLSFLFDNPENTRPKDSIKVIKTELTKINKEQDCLVWFGHSSVLMYIDGKSILIDLVFLSASPLPFINKPFKGTGAYHPEDIPNIDYLIISHDHWDHLDYETVKEIKDRVSYVICPLGVGEHFERWGFNMNNVIEMDWHETHSFTNSINIHCLPSRHFSARGFKRNKTLWASFLIESKDKKVYISADGGYDKHFKEIGEKFPGIDLAILENGQYNINWKDIHLMPDEIIMAAKDLRAEKVLTVHHSKFALSKHHWQEPLRNIERAKDSGLNVLSPKIGEIVLIK